MHGVWYVRDGGVRIVVLLSIYLTMSQCISFNVFFQMQYDDSSEKEMMMEMSKSSSGNRRSSSFFTSSKLKSSSPELRRYSSSSTKGLGKSIVSRLRKLEVERVEHLARIESQEKEISMLNKMMENMNVGHDVMNTIRDLKKENEDMKKYLASIGMKWEGYNMKKEGSTTNDLETFVRAMEQLNIASDRLSIKGGNRFVEAPNVPVAVYRDGLMLWRGPFRSFDKDETARSFVRDCTRGYFPSELRTRWPDGVHFQITDKRDFKYEDAKKSQKQTSNNSGCKTMTKCQFLRRLPDNRITKDGRVNHVRERIASSINTATNISTGSSAAGDNTTNNKEKERERRRAVMVAALNRRMKKSSAGK